MTELAQEEAVAWAMMRSFEALAVEQYARHAPDLLTDEKKAVLSGLQELAPDDTPLTGSALGQPIADLVKAARGDEQSTLLVQALLLEQLGALIYDAVKDKDRVSAGGRSLATMGAAAAAATIERVPDLIENRIGNGDAAFDAFTATTGDVLSQLDGLGEAVDELFGEAYDLHFADVMGDLTAELLPICTGLGMKRRQLMMYLASCLMTAA
jgi:hypothetical protein